MPSKAGGASATSYDLSVGIMLARGLCMSRAPASSDVHGHGRHCVLSDWDFVSADSIFFFFSSPLTSDVMQFTSMFQMTTTKYSQIENHLYKTVSSDPAIFKRMDRGSVSNYCSPSSHDPIGII